MPTPRFTALYPGPTVQWGGAVKQPSGITASPRFCTTNLWALDDEGQSWALTYDAVNDDAPPTWVRLPDAQSP